MGWGLAMSSTVDSFYVLSLLQNWQHRCIEPMVWWWQRVKVHKEGCTLKNGSLGMGVENKVCTVCALVCALAFM